MVRADCVCCPRELLRKEVSTILGIIIFSSVSATYFYRKRSCQKNQLIALDWIISIGEVYSTVLNYAVLAGQLDEDDPLSGVDAYDLIIEGDRVVASHGCHENCSLKPDPNKT